MKKRIESLARIGKLQAKLHDLGKSRLATIERERVALSDDIKAVLEALEIGDLAYGRQASLSARHVRGLQKRLDALVRESDQVRRKAQAHGMRAKLAEKASETAAQRLRDQKERRELAELVERAIMRHRASPT